MKNHTEYLYSFSNASLTLKVIEHLKDRYQSHLNSVAVINLIDRWIVKISFKNSLENNLAKNLQAILKELGIPDRGLPIIRLALAKLEMGESPIKIMNHYQVAIVAYGKPETEEIEIFREEIVDRLGYCPQNMA